MTALFTIVLLFAQPAPQSLEQVRSEANPEHRARAAVEFAATAERNAETAYYKGDMKSVAAELNSMAEAAEIARKALQQTGKSPSGHPGPFKYGELRTQEILVRLNDLEHKMDEDEREVITAPKAKLQEIHDLWFDGIMSGKRK
ncbi:MAG: hypothetical protein ABJC09_04695 [Terriglobia bacterium]